MTDPYPADEQGSAVLSGDFLPPQSGITADVMGNRVLPPEEITDGFHTMTELYAHRRALTAVLATIAAIDAGSWRSKAHNPADDPIFDGYFIVGIELPEGPVSYHYELKFWDEFAAVPIVEHAPKWDGHTSADVLARLDDFRQALQVAVAEGLTEEVAREVLADRLGQVDGDE